MTEHRLPPHSLDAERALLGSILIDADVFAETQGTVQPQMFYTGQHRAIYEAMCNLNQRSEPIDIITLPDELKNMNKGGEDSMVYIVSLINTVPTSANADSYARTVKDKWTRRKMLKVASQMAKLAYGEDGELREQLAQAETATLALSDSRISDGLLSPREYMPAFLDELYERYNSDNPVFGVPTGFKELDNILKGFVDGKLYLLAGNTGAGKSSVMSSMLDELIITNNLRVATFGMEMSRPEWIYRIAARRTGIPTTDIQSGNLTEEQLSRVVDVAGRISERDLYIDDTPALTPSEMAAKCRRMYAENGLDIIFVDYLQLMRGDRQRNNKVNEVGDLSAALLALARTLNVPVVAASQLSRKNVERADKRPLLSDLRDSGNLEQDAYAVIMVYIDEMWNDCSPDKGIAELIVRKHRNGPVGTARVGWKKECTSFRDMQFVPIP